MSKAEIRLTKTEELKSVLDLNYQLFLRDNEYFEDLNVRWPYEEAGTNYFKKMIAGDNGCCFVAEVNGQVVGYLAGCLLRSHSAYQPGKRSEIENMFIKAEFRRQGIGRRLIEAFYEWSRQHGVRYVKVGAYADNKEAVAFYGALGLRPYNLFLLHDLQGKET